MSCHLHASGRFTPRYTLYKGLDGIRAGLDTWKNRKSCPAGIRRPPSLYQQSYSIGNKKAISCPFYKYGGPKFVIMHIFHRLWYYLVQMWTCLLANQEESQTWRHVLFRRTMCLLYPVAISCTLSLLDTCFKARFKIRVLHCLCWTSMARNEGRIATYSSFLMSAFNRTPSMQSEVNKIAGSMLTK
jgi:hypothetical protein